MSDDRNADFAKRLRKVKEEKDLTLRKIADGVGVSEAAVSKWASGQGITTDKLDRLASFLNVEPGWLLFGAAGSAARINSAAPQQFGISPNTPSGITFTPATISPVASPWLAAGLADELSRVIARFSADTGRAVSNLRLVDGRVEVELKR